MKPGKTKTLVKLIRSPLVAVAVGLLVIPPVMFAVMPPPDGGYPGGNTAEGQNALLSRTNGMYNAAVGWLSLENLTTGTANTGVGAGTLALNNGDRNTATGAGALLFNTGSDNTASGVFALLYNTADQNCAFGSQALFNNTAGSDNTAMGYQALFTNTGSNANTAFGAYTLQSNTDGNFNTAGGFSALQGNTTGAQNTAVGSGALLLNTTGGDNTAVGVNALLNETNGGNTAVGSHALSGNASGYGNTAVGSSALFDNMTGYYNIALGYEAGLLVTTASDVIAIGSAGADVSDTTWIGNVYGKTTQSGATLPVVVSDGGQLGTMSSSRRFKKQIKPMDKDSEAIFKLKPVTFRYRNDTKGTRQFGLIAEEVATASPDLVVRDADGEIYTVRYDAVNVMFLNEFLKEHHKVEAQQSKIEKQEGTIAQLQSEVHSLIAHSKEHDLELQKVRGQMQRMRSSAQLALTDN
jgi:endosialidase-like protein